MSRTIATAAILTFGVIVSATLSHIGRPSGKARPAANISVRAINVVLIGTQIRRWHTPRLIVGRVQSSARKSHPETTDYGGARQTDR